LSYGCLEAGKASQASSEVKEARCAWQIGGQATKSAKKVEAPNQKRAVSKLFLPYLVVFIAISDAGPENASASVSLLDIDGAARKHVFDLLVGATDIQADVTTRNVG